MEEQEKNKPETDQREKIVKDPFQPQGPRDGLDNTGTQGYDSLKDDGYTGDSEKDTDGDTKDGTASVVTP
ncbi:MAG: hypothetical protein ABWY16_03565 [Pedobacter sp.]|uniref:hypothetical protein n=1 Tax=Pedobacter sp. TaxID=1411316 RepID=UPI00339695C3